MGPSPKSSWMISADVHRNVSNMFCSIWHTGLGRLNLVSGGCHGDNGVTLAWDGNLNPVTVLQSLVREQSTHTNRVTGHAVMRQDNCEVVGEWRFKRKPTNGTRWGPTLFDKWNGIFYMPSRTDMARHTMATRNLLGHFCQKYTSDGMGPMLWGSGLRTPIGTWNGNSATVTVACWYMTFSAIYTYYDVAENWMIII